MADTDLFRMIPPKTVRDADHPELDDLGLDDQEIERLVREGLSRDNR